MNIENVLIDVPVHAESLQKLQTTEDVHVDVIEAVEATRYIDKELIADKHILFCDYPPENFGDMKQIELIQLASSGYTQLFDLELHDRNIKVCNAAGVNDMPIAEWSVAMMVNLARNMRVMMKNQDSRIWDRDAKFQGEISGSILGIWGYGGIGRQTARLAKNMGMRIYALDAQDIGPRREYYTVEGSGDAEGVLPDRVFSPGTETEFLADLDFLLLSMPLTKATTGLVGEEHLRALPEKAFVLNPARGPLIQEKALVKAIEEKWIAGAALDTHYYYPMPPKHPLWGFENVILTPHISGAPLSPFFTERLWDMFLQNIKRYLSNMALLNQLTNAQLSGN